MYKQIDLDNIDFLEDFLCSMSTNKVASKPQNSIVASSKAKSF